MQLNIEKLSLTYPGGVQALKDVSLTIPFGMFGLLGANGAGKSTLMRILATLQQPDCGIVQFGELDILEQPQALRRRLGYLPQEFGLYPKIGAEELLLHLAALKGLSGKHKRATVQALLERTNLWQARARKVGTFSGGMKQRFGIAQALLGDPQLIIVDEPTAGLDPEERTRFLNLLSEIGEQRVVILSTHIVDDVADLCTRMAILSEGRLLRQGEPLELVAELEGKVWRAHIDKHQLPSYQERHQVLSTRLWAGRRVVRVLSATCPGEEFNAVAPEIEDVYFTTLQQQGDRNAHDA